MPLGKGSILNLNPQGDFPPDVEVSPRLSLGVADPVVGLQQQHRRQQAGHHAGAAIVRTVQLGEISIAEQLPPQRGQQAVEGVPTHQVQIQLVRFPKSHLIRSLAQHRALHSANLAGPEYNPLLYQPGFPARFPVGRHGAIQGSAVRRMTEGSSARKSMWISSSPVWWGRRMAIQ